MSIKTSIVRLKPRLKEPYTLSNVSVARLDAFVFVTEDKDGNRGYGEATPLKHYTDETSESILSDLRAVQKMLQGFEPEDAPGIDQMIDKIFRGDPKRSFSRSAVEISLYDLLARRMGTDFIDTFGNRQRRKIGLVGNMGIFDIQKTLQAAEQFRKDGFTTLKMKVGRKLDDDIARVKTVCDTYPELSIRVDANQGLDYRQSRELFLSLKGCNIELIEQPMKRGHLDSHAKLRRDFDIPLMLDEEIYSIHDIQEIISQGAADMIKSKAFKSGIRETLKIAEIAEESDIGFIWGNGVETHVGAFAEVKLACAISHINPVCECIGPLKLESNPTTMAFEPIKAQLEDKNTIGLGFQLK